MGLLLLYILPAEICLACTAQIPLPWGLIPLNVKSYVHQVYVLFCSLVQTIRVQVSTYHNDVLGVIAVDRVDKSLRDVLE